MKLRWSDLWRWDGTLDRGPYAAWGVLLFALKYNLDRLVATLHFGHPWWLFNYLHLDGDAFPLSLDSKDARLYASLVALALPFIYSGVVMSLRRLRSAGLPLPAVALFFVPLINLIFFFTLSLLPGKPSPEDPPRPKSWLDAMIPRGALGSAALALLVTGVAGVPLTMLAVDQLHGYGFGLFLGLPFALGLVAALIHSHHERRSLGACISVAVLSVLLLGMGLLLAAVEGVICLLMAAPIGVTLAGLGGAVGYAIRSGGHRAAAQVGALMVFLLPVLMGAESLDPARPPLIAVTTSIEVNVPPEKVWPHVIAFTELPPPDDWVFKTGIAYPIRARILGTGVGAVRRCEFSTGPFVEPITTWDAPRHLAFDVVAQPRSMNELSPWGAIHAPHIDHFLVSEHGEFRLEPLPGGHTRLLGTTWYRHKIWPVAYWRPWSDAILHHIHTRVLKHVKALSEGQANGE